MTEGPTRASPVRRWLSVLPIVALVGACSASTMSRSDNLASVWRDPWKYHDRVLDVRVFPYDLGNDDYLACDRPCPEPVTSDIGNNWIVPSDPAAFRGWRGTQAVRLRVRVNASSFAPGAFWGHLPIHLEEVSPDTPPDTH